MFFTRPNSAATVYKTEVMAEERQRFAKLETGRDPKPTAVKNGLFRMHQHKAVI